MDEAMCDDNKLFHKYQQYGWIVDCYHGVIWFRNTNSQVMIFSQCSTLLVDALVVSENVIS